MGRPDRAGVYAAADAVEHRTGLTVNPVIASVKRWNDESDPLMVKIKASPGVEIDLRPLEVQA